MLAELDRPVGRPTWFGAMLIVLSLSIEQSRAYSSGAPLTACSSMTPSHSGSPQPTATSPYAVYVSSGQYAPGGQLTVTINGTQQFKGFLLIARTSSSNSLVGTFEATPLSKQACGSGLTHTSGTPTNSLSVQWTAPASSQGAVLFYATVVQSKLVYWVALSSNIVSEILSSSTASITVTSSKIVTEILASSPASTTVTVSPQSPASTSTVRTTSSTNGSVIALTKAQAGCGATASCFSSPSGCTGSDCNYLLAWRPLSASSSGSGLLQFQLQGRTTSKPSYVSVGFGQSKSMNGLSVVNCVATNSGATITQTYSSSQSSEPAFLSVASNLQNVTAVSSTDFIRCSFVWNNSARASAQQYDLTASYYLVMARGPAIGNAAGNIMRHTDNPIYLNDRVTIASTLNADYPLKLTTFSTDEPNKATESRSTASGIHGTEIPKNVTFKNAGITLSRHFAMQWILGLLPCVIALAV